MIEITIPIEVKSRNEIDKMHWAVKQRLRQTYELLIRNQMRLNKVPLAEKKKYTMTIICYRKRRIRDRANLIGGAKTLVDALVNEGFLWDDSDKYLIDWYRQELGKPKTVIRREG